MTGKRTPKYPDSMKRRKDWTSTNRVRRTSSGTGNIPALKQVAEPTVLDMRFSNCYKNKDEKLILHNVINLRKKQCQIALHHPWGKRHLVLF